MKLDIFGRQTALLFPYSKPLKQSRLESGSLRRVSVLEKTKK